MHHEAQTISTSSTGHNDLSDSTFDVPHDLAQGSTCQRAFNIDAVILGTGLRLYNATAPTKASMRHVRIITPPRSVGQRMRLSYIWHWTVGGRYGNKDGFHQYQRLSVNKVTPCLYRIP